MTILADSVPAVNSLPAAKLDAIMLHFERTRGDNPDVATVEPDCRESYMDVWTDETLWAEDFSLYMAESLAAQANPEPANASAEKSPKKGGKNKSAEASDESEPGCLKGASDTKLSRYEKTVADITELVVGKFTDEAKRNYAIGAKAFEFLTWQANNFKGFTGQDCERTVGTIHQRVCAQLDIDSKSIKIMEWVKTHLLRKLVIDAKGTDVADRLSHSEYMRLVGRALAFDKGEVSGSLVDGWLDFILSVSTKRSAGERVSYETFKASLAAHANALAEAKAPKPEPKPVLNAERQAIVDAAKAKEEATVKRNAALAGVKATVANALNDSDASLDMVLANVQQAAESLGHKIPSTSPTTLDNVSLDSITIRGIDRLIDALIANGRGAELLHIQARVSAGLDTFRAMMASRPEFAGAVASAPEPLANVA